MTAARPDPRSLCPKCGLPGYNMERHIPLCTAPWPGDDPRNLIPLDQRPAFSMALPKEIAAGYPVTLIFGTPQEAEDFVELVRCAQPGLVLKTT